MTVNAYIPLQNQDLHLLWRCIGSAIILNVPVHVELGAQAMHGRPDQAGSHIIQRILRVEKQGSAGSNLGQYK